MAIGHHGFWTFAKILFNLIHCRLQFRVFHGRVNHIGRQDKIAMRGDCCQRSEVRGIAPFLVGHDARIGIGRGDLSGIFFGINLLILPPILVHLLNLFQGLLQLFLSRFCVP